MGASPNLGLHRNRAVPPDNGVGARFRAARHVGRPFVDQVKTPDMGASQHSIGLTRKDIKGVIESLANIGYKELKKAGAFFVPGFREIRCHQEARYEGAKRHQSVHKGAHDIPSQTGKEGYQGSPREGCQRRSSITRSLAVNDVVRSCGWVRHLEAELAGLKSALG